MPSTITLRPDTAEKYEIVDYKGSKDEVHVLGHGDIVFSKLTPEACEALLSRKFPFLRKKEEKNTTTATTPKLEKTGKPE